MFLNTYFGFSVENRFWEEVNRNGAFRQETTKYACAESDGSIQIAGKAQAQCIIPALKYLSIKLGGKYV